MLIHLLGPSVSASERTALFGTQIRFITSHFEGFSLTLKFSFIMFSNTWKVVGYETTEL